MQFPSTLELSLRILLAAVLGGVIGLEREINDHPAGLRTHITLSIGSALFGIVSAFAFGGFDVPRDETVFQVDVTRVASNIVTGVGFLGGGAILKYGANVRGLTTAASLWATAAIGLAVALGAYVIAIVSTAAVLLSLVALLGPRRWIARRLSRSEQRAFVHMAPEGDVTAVVGAVTALSGLELASLVVQRSDEGVVIEVRTRAGTSRELERLLAPLAERHDVAAVEVS